TSSDRIPTKVTLAIRPKTNQENVCPAPGLPVTDTLASWGINDIWRRPLGAEVYAFFPLRSRDDYDRHVCDLECPSRRLHGSAGAAVHCFAFCRIGRHWAPVPGQSPKSLSKSTPSLVTR